MAKLGWTRFWFLVATVLSLYFIVANTQSGACYQSASRSRRAYRSRGYSDYYSCGFLWLSRCSRTRYRSEAYTTYYTTSVFGCCSGYGVCGSSSCCPICNEPCLNGGTCISPDTCGCTSGWTNTTCQSDVDECNETALNNCDHYCTNTIGSYNCSCDDGYRLSSNRHTCLDIDECTVGTALCADLCHNTNGSYYCSCSGTGYRLRSDGISCENINECDEGIDACAQHCMDTEGSYNCSCGTGYTLANDGLGCDDIDECRENTDNCEQVCVNTMGSFTCGCDSGYELTSDGRTCQDVDECSEMTHTCSQNCHNSVGSYVCTCDEGFIISSNGITCIDINECLENNGECSDACTNTAGSFTCSCNTGYELNVDERTCHDTDECATGTHLCDQDCTNTIGSYNCSCGTGYRLNNNGYQCDEINECEEETHSCEQVCVNTNGAYRCSCNEGYRINSDQMTCTDIDECSSGIHQCTQNCLNTNGSYVCSCYSGFIIDVDGRRCDDIDECSDGVHSCQQVCNNTQGSHHCLCHDGYQLNSDNYSCRDLDECANGVDGCDQNCHNYNGSYRCSCNPGFRLNGLHCDDINECESGRHNCIEVCINTDGSYKCTCNDGYILSSNGSLCNDVDECATGQSECDQNCYNTIGSYNCSCNDGYLLHQDSIHCSDVDECALKVDNCEQVCVNHNGSYTCDCSEGYELVNGSSYACQDINECDPNVAVCEQICMNSNGSYTCDCLPGYSRTSDQLSCLGPLINVTFAPTSFRTLTLSWHPLVDPERRHGDVLRYPTVCVSENNQENTFITYGESDSRELVLQALLPYSTYNCCVSVQTTLANSSAVCKKARTLEEAPGGPPTGVVFDNQSPYRVLVLWNPPNIPNGVITHYTIYVGYENRSVDVFHVNAQSTAYNVSNLYPFQIINVEISASTVVGEGPRTPRMEVQTAQTSPSQVRNVVVNVISNVSIIVQWDPPARPNGILTYYDIVVYNEWIGFNISREILSLERQEVTIGGLRVFVPYTVQVFASTTAGRGDPVTTTIFTGHGVPAVPTLLSIERINTTSTRVNWVPLTPDEARGVLTNLEIAYEPVRVEGCNNFNQMDREAVYVTENLFEQSTAIVSGLEPNQEYCIAIKVSTSGGESGFSNSILIPLAKRVPFQIRFPLSNDVDCSEFVATNSTGKISDISSAVSNTVTQLCKCQYPPKFLVDSRLFCSVDKSEVIFQSHLLTTDDKTAEEIRNLTQLWVLTKPTLRINNKMYLLDPYCSVVLDELGETTCDAISPTEAEIDEAAQRFTILEIVSVAIMGFLLVLLFATFAVIAYLIIRLHKRHSMLLTSTTLENDYEVCGDYDGKTSDSLVATTKIDSDLIDDDCHKPFNS